MTDIALTDSPYIRRSRFTIYHGLVASVMIHAAIAVPFILRRLEPPPQEPSLLTVELDGMVSDTQAAQQVMEETKGSVKQDEQQAVKPAEKVEAPPTEELPPPEPPARKTEPVVKQEVVPDPTDETLPAPPPPPVAQPETSSSSSAAADAGTLDIKGQREQQAAQRLQQQRQEEIDRLKSYANIVYKKVMGHLVYPKGGQRPHGTATVSFFITSSGAIRPDSIRIVDSSGKADLDEAAIKSIRASSPFEAPPREIPLAIPISFHAKH